MSKPFFHLDLFSGIGGFSLAAQTVWGSDYHCVGFCEIDSFCQQVLRKNFEGVRIWGDIKELSWNEAKDKSDIPLNSSPLPTQPRKPDELSVDANAVESLFPCLPVSPITTGDGGSVPSNVDTSSCVETRGQMQGAVSGCVVNTTLNGKMEQGTTDHCNDGKTKLPNGDGECSQETTTPVSRADISQGSPILSMPTISSRGVSTPTSGSTSPMGSLSVSSATRSCTEKNGRPSIDLLTAGVPCQPASCAGKRRGTSDDRWLWGEAYRIIREARPKWVILENVRGLLTLGNGVVFEDLLTELESYGYETETCIIPACAVNAPHRRDRVWIVAHSKNEGCSRVEDEQGEAGIEAGGYPVRSSRGFADCPSSDTSGLVVSARSRDGAEASSDSQTQWDALGNESGVLGESANAQAREGRSIIANPSILGQSGQGESEQPCDPAKGGNGEATEPLNGGELRFPDWSRDWREVAFGTCVRQLDDGLPRRLVRLPDGSTITESKWRQESLKCYGNAIVPQVAMVIMAAIKAIDHE